LNELPEKYPHFFDLLERTTEAESAENIRHFGYFIAIDAEWHESKGRNVVLSYQIATVNRECAKNIIKYVPAGKRLPLSGIVEIGIRSVHGGSLPQLAPGEKLRVVLIAHNFAAEWSALADRDTPKITKRLTLIRKTPITDGHAIKLKLGKKPLEVKIFDTMLLAPATHRSLAKLSGLLEEEFEKKLSIKQKWIENMDRYLREDPEGFERYALRDSEVCLKLFFLLQQSLNELAYGPGAFEKLFRTLASAAVAGFTQHPDNAWFENYRLVLGLVPNPTRTQEKILENYPDMPKFREAYKLIKRSYMGGRNESFLIGDTRKFAETRGRIWIDIDLSNAYPSSMALCPLIDPEGEILETALRYQLDQEAVERLLSENVPADLVHQARQALEESHVTFEVMLQEVKRVSHRERIRHHATVIDNRLIRRWQEMADQGAPWASESYVIPGFARVRFHFPKRVHYPCLAVRHPRYGLIYPRQGETVATAPEILLALSAGAKIEAIASVELPIATNKPDGKPHGGPYCFFTGHLKKAIRKRTGYKKRKGDPVAQIYEKLLKEFVNSFYGKFSQSINPRSMFRPATGEMVTLGPSTITEPSVASLTTGLTRAVLSALLLAIERYNRGRAQADQVSLISATTDGLLMGISAPEGYSVESDYYVRRDNVPILRSDLKKEDPDYAPIEVPQLLERFGHGELLAAFAKQLPVRQLIQARKSLTGSGAYLEVKHLVDEVVSVKTRGQIGLLTSGDIPLLARFGHKPPLSEIIEDPEEYKRVMEAGGVVRNNEDGKWLLERFERIEDGLEEVEKYTFITLTSFRKMLESRGRKDLVRQIRPQASNFDYDWKRKLISECSPVTDPFDSVDEMLLYRRQMEAIRASGRVARPEQVRHRVRLKQKSTNARGGESAALIRQFLRGVTQGHIALQEPLSYAQMVERLDRLGQHPEVSGLKTKTWSIDTLKNAKRRPWEPGVILPTVQTRRLLRGLCEVFGTNEEAAAALLLTSPEFLNENAAQIQEVVRAVLHAPGEGIEPFRRLYDQGRLPDKPALLAVFHPVLTEALFKECERGRFLPASRHSHERPQLVKLFGRLGLSRKHAEECTRVLAPPAEKRTRPRRNPGQKRCLEHFVMALQQNDIQSLERKPGTIIERLSRFGLRRSRYYELRNFRFTPRALADSPENRRQIKQMARSLRLDPTPYLDQLLDVKR
jgi:hypothetical protein